MSGCLGSPALHSAVADVNLRTGIERRFWEKVSKSDGCWEWRGWRTKQGYGLKSVNGQMQTCHRLSWVLTNGPIPEGKHVLHHCDNPPCVRPDHLFLGDHHANMRDAANKGKFSGENKWSAKLDWNKVRSMRSRLADLYRELAKQNNVSVCTVKSVLQGRYWNE